MNRWNDIAIVLQDCQSGKILEKDYQPKIEEQFKLLGWSVYYGCIESKPELETANTSIFPDIVLKKEGKRVLPIELKRPTNRLKKKNERQLFSYMRQLELRVGLYIGEKMHLYFNAPDDDNAPHPILTTGLEAESAEGILLCDLLAYENFDSLKLENFCKQRLQSQRYEKKLKEEFEQQFSPDQGPRFIRQLIKDYYSKECINENVLNQEIAKISLASSYGTLKKKQSTKRESKRYTKYTLNGSKPMYKRTLVLEAMRLYIAKYPTATYEEIERVFNVKEMPGGYKVVRRLSDIQDGLETGSLSGRFFIAPQQLLESADGVTFAVSTQWEYHNFPIFVGILKKLKWKVKEV